MITETVLVQGKHCCCQKNFRQSFRRRHDLARILLANFERDSVNFYVNSTHEECVAEQL